MQVLRDASPVPPVLHGSVIALGNFDGLHLGHAAIINETFRLARAAGAPAALLTFEPHPRRVFKPDLPTLRLFSLAEKARRLRAMGLTFLRVVRFTPGFARTTAEQFVVGLLQGRLHVSHVVTGEDFIFGHNRAGNAAYLREMAVKHGFGYTACAEVSVGGERCSSSRIRALLESGNVRCAQTLLGRPYSITGRVQSGDKRGRTIGFPTANIIPCRLFTPAAGVYAVQAHVRGQYIKGVANLGLRPTFGGTRLQLEVHLFDWQEDIYGESIRVEFMDFIRPERKFSGVDALKEQIKEDVLQARRLLAEKVL